MFSAPLAHEKSDRYLLALEPSLGMLRVAPGAGALRWRDAVDTQNHTIPTTIPDSI